MDEISDLTGKPAGYSSAYLGKRISWQAFAKLTRTPRGEVGGRDMVEVEPHQYVTATVAEAEGLAGAVAYSIAATSTDRPKGCPIPPSAVLRGKGPRPYREPRQQPIYWLGRKALFPSRYTDPTRENRGFPKRPHLDPVSKTMVELLRPLSAKCESRFVFRSEPIRKDVTAPPASMRSPLAEEHTAGRIDARLMGAADWFSRDILASAKAKIEGVRMRTSTGAMAAYGSRNPLDLWPAEASADRAIRLRWRFRTLGPLARIVWRALQGAEMAELAPAWPFPQRNKAEAGRIRLRAGLELCARMAEREVDRLPLWEVLQVTQAACAECMKLEATRRMRVLIPANDNWHEIQRRIAA